MSGSLVFKTALRGSPGAEGRKGGRGGSCHLLQNQHSNSCLLGERQVRLREGRQAHNVILQVPGKGGGPVPLFTLLLFFLQKETGLAPWHKTTAQDLYA